MVNTNKFQNRRIMTDDGWEYYCRTCMVYKPENEFYKRKDASFGYDYRCKIHRRGGHKTSIKSDPTMRYFRLGRLSDDDFTETQILLSILGYKTGKDHPPVWEQFNKRHNL